MGQYADGLKSMIQFSLSEKRFLVCYMISVKWSGVGRFLVMMHPRGSIIKGYNSLFHTTRNNEPYGAMTSH